MRYWARLAAVQRRPFVPYPALGLWGGGSTRVEHGNVVDGGGAGPVWHRAGMWRGLSVGQMVERGWPGKGGSTNALDVDAAIGLAEGPGALPGKCQHSAASWSRPPWLTVEPAARTRQGLNPPDKNPTRPALAECKLKNALGTVDVREGAAWRQRGLGMLSANLRGEEHWSSEGRRWVCLPEWFSA